MIKFDFAAPFVITVGADRTLHLPDAIPNGATVAVIVLPSNWSDDENLRQAHFTAALEQIRIACDQPPKPPRLSDQELNQRIRQLRKQMSAA